MNYGKMKRNLKNKKFEKLDIKLSMFYSGVVDLLGNG